jgi:glutamine amidotransferase
MCRLFGLTAGRERVAATFWLLDAPDSLQVQSRRNVDGAGIGFFDAARTPVIPDVRGARALGHRRRAGER